MSAAGPCQTARVNSRSPAPKPSRSAPTLEEVAAHAGVSRATASRALRGASNVSDQAREQVLAAAQAIAYTPNLAARSLVTGRSGSVAFVIDESEERMFSDPFFLGMLRSAHKAVAGAGLQLVFTVMSSQEDHDRFVSYAAGGHVDGVLLVSLHGRDELPRQLEELGVPTVLSGRPPRQAPGLYYVDADNIGGGRLATEHLLNSGRRAVATITGPLDMGAGQDRLSGFRQALAQAGVAPDEGLVAEGEFTAASGFEVMSELIRRRPDVDGLFAASDLIAVGAIRAIHASGRRIPEDVAIVGFDDIPGAAELDPPLTTVRQPVAELGAEMTRLLLDRIEGAEPTPGRVLPVELVVRRSA